MSWSISCVGTADGVSKALDKHEETLSGQSKDEFLAAKPHLQGLLAQCVKQNVRLNANGHATFQDGEKTYGSCSVTLEQFYGEWCE